MPPMTYLRQVRLRRAREALQAAEPRHEHGAGRRAGLGMLHLGRFAAAYREAFGEAPSETLPGSSERVASPVTDRGWRPG